jgi:penicillin-binding protein 1A
MRIATVLSIVLLIAAGAGYSWFDRTILSTLPKDLSSYRTYRPPTACRVYSNDGTLVDQFYVERRIWVPLSELDPWTWQAFIAAEDRRFMEHGGVDVLGIARAMWVNYMAGHDVQGASTITQQLVKNLMVGKERSYERKLKEAVLAYRLEQELSKAQILELYVNYIALGSGNYGVEAASQDYFGISARDLDPGQAAELGGLVPAPSRYSPRADPEMAARRRELVLGGMVEMGFVDAEDVPQYLDDPVLQERQTKAEKQAGGAYVTQVRREVRRVLGDDIPFSQGLQVHTPLDLDVQKVAEQAVKDALIAHRDRQGRRGAVRNVPEAQWQSFLERGHGLPTDPVTAERMFPTPGTCFEALVGPEKDLDDLRSGTWHFALRKDQRDALVRDPDPEGENKPRALKLAIHAGDVLQVCLEDPSTSGGTDVAATARQHTRHEDSNNPRVRLEDRPWSEGAAVVIENRTGRVLAIVGGYDVGLEGFVRATQAKRQPGSSFKPYVYGTALLQGHSQIDMVLDAPISLPGASGAWSPKNYSGGYSGNLPMRRALAKSLNTVSVRLILETGVASVIRTAHAMGVTSPLRADPTLALGSSEVTPMDQALGYATIARMGVKTEPVWIDLVRDVNNTPVGRAGESVVLNGAAVALLPGGAGEQVIPSGTAYELADMMREVVRSGTARRAYDEDLDRAGKTGTTNDNIDAWFVGFTPRYTIAVWVGTDGTGSLGDGETGGKTALPAWLTIAAALPEPAGERLPLPSDAMLVPWEGEWVGFPRGAVPESVLRGPRTVDGPLPAFPVGGKWVPPKAAAPKVAPEAEDRGPVGGGAR